MKVMKDYLLYTTLSIHFQLYVKRFIEHRVGSAIVTHSSAC